MNSGCISAADHLFAYKNFVTVAESKCKLVLFRNKSVNKAAGVELGFDLPIWL